MDLVLVRAERQTGHQEEHQIPDLPLLVLWAMILSIPTTFTISGFALVILILFPLLE